MKNTCESFNIPVRYILTLVGFYCFFNVYATRVNLNVAIVAMVKGRNESQRDDTTQKVDSCPELRTMPQNNSFQNIDNRRNPGEFDWDSHEQGLVLGSFYYGYVLTQIPGGMLAEKFGPKMVCGIGMLISTILTLLSPIAARWSIWALIMVRVVQGVGQGVAFPSINTLIGRWAPLSERSRMSTLIYAGYQIGIVVSLTVSGILSDSYFLGGWPSVFYVFGAVSCLWLILWMTLIVDFPDDHPRITKEELLHINRGKNINQIKRRPFPWTSALTSMPVWALTISQFGQAWSSYILIILTPTYLSNVLHIELKKNGILSAVPHLLFFVVAIIASIIADKLRQNGYLKITTIRKVCHSVGSFGPAICLLAIPLLDCKPIAIVSLLTLAVGINGFVNSGYLVTHVDMTPEFAGTLFGITNFVSNFAGFLGPAYVGWIVQDGQTKENWNIIFITSAAVFIVCGLVYDLFASAEPQMWDYSPAAIHEEKELDDFEDKSNIEALKAKC